MTAFRMNQENFLVDKTSKVFLQVLFFPWSWLCVYGAVVFVVKIKNTFHLHCATQTCARVSRAVVGVSFIPRCGSGRVTHPMLQWAYFSSHAMVGVVQWSHCHFPGHHQSSFFLTMTSIFRWLPYVAKVLFIKMNSRDESFDVVP